MILLKLFVNHPIQVQNKLPYKFNTGVCMSVTRPLSYLTLFLFPSNSESYLLEDMIIETVGQDIKLLFNWCVLTLANSDRSQDVDFSETVTNNQIFLWPWTTAHPTLTSQSIIQIKMLLHSTKTQQNMDLSPFQTASLFLGSCSGAKYPQSFIWGFSCWRYHYRLLQHLSSCISFHGFNSPQQLFKQHRAV